MVIFDPKLMREQLKKLKRTVIIEVAQTQSINTLQPIEMEEEAEGSLYQVDDTTYILAYDSIINHQKVTTTLKLSGNTLSLVRIGDVHSRQTFCMNEWLTSQYFYGGSSIVCRNYTKKLDFAINQQGGLIDVLYELWSGDTHLGFYNMEWFIH